MITKVIQHLKGIILTDCLGFTELNKKYWGKNLCQMANSIDQLEMSLPTYLRNIIFTLKINF